MVTREQILDEIKRTAARNGGKPLGTDRFEQETGIKQYDWGKYWARFGEAQRAAGFEPNQMAGAHPEDYIAEQVALIARKLGKFPTFREIVVERQTNPELPTKNVFQRFGGKAGLARLTKAFCAARPEYQDVVGLCDEVLADGSSESDDTAGEEVSDNSGEVYLYKSGRYYKIGKTNDTVRRGTELRLQLPETPVLVHSIKTDDPTGVELYWHRRFAGKRVNGEWFDLGAAEIRAFKRWRRIF